MKNIIIIVFGFLFLKNHNCFGQEIINKNPVSLSEVNFKSIFGSKSSDSLQVYCLLGTGFFRTVRSKNADSLIADWISKHPQSTIIPISTLNQVSIETNEKLTYCWVVDNKDTLNVFLIKNGCFPGGTKQRPQTWKEMSSKEKKLYKGEDKPNIQIHIDNKKYLDFFENIMSAEIFAKENKFGIWKDKK